MSFGELDPMAHVAVPVPDDDSLWVDDFSGDDAHAVTTGEGTSRTSCSPGVPLRRWDMLDVTLGGYMDVDEMVLLFESEECVYMAKGNDIVEARLTQFEKDLFSIAKDEALKPWADNGAWKATPETDTLEGEVCPLRFLLKWKMKAGVKTASARVIMQGFKHKDVLEGEVDKDSPTLSRLGRHCVFQHCSQRQWKLFLADVKSAFLQSEDIVPKGLRIFGKPNADMRRRLGKTLGLKANEVLRMKKPAFGDVRAPKLWNGTADSTMVGLGFAVHKLDKCLY